MRKPQFVLNYLSSIYVLLYINQTLCPIIKYFQTILACQSNLNVLIHEPITKCIVRFLIQKQLNRVEGFELHANNKAQLVFNSLR